MLLFRRYFVSIPAEWGHSETLSLLQEGLLREEQSGNCCYSFLIIITWMLSIEGGLVGLYLPCVFVRKMSCKCLNTSQDCPRTSHWGLTQGYLWTVLGHSSWGLGRLSWGVPLEVQGSTGDAMGESGGIHMYLTPAHTYLWRELSVGCHDGGYHDSGWLTLATATLSWSPTMRESVVMQTEQRRTMFVSIATPTPSPRTLCR